MSKQDFLQNAKAFIDSEIYGAQQCEDKLTEDEWRRWIKAEEADQIAQGVEHELFTDQELDWIIEELSNAGVVAE